MDRSFNTWRTESQEGEHDFKCEECGEEFHKPITARLSSRGSVQTYEACPRCLTKVSEPESNADKEEMEEPTVLKNIKKTVERIENTACTHFLGYLKKRPKDQSIPEDCLVCEKMIECMAHNTSHDAL